MGKKHREGFTLIELLVLMMVLAVVIGFGVPALGDIVANSRMSQAANDLVSSLQAARAEASTRNRSVTICASSDWDAEHPGCDAGTNLLDGWIVFEDTNDDGVVDAAEPVLQAHGPLDDSIRLQSQSKTDRGPPQYVSFRDSGTPQDIAGLAPGVRNIQLCDARGNVDTGDGRAAGRWIMILPAGRPLLIDHVAQLQDPANTLGGC
jgi:type IV fimbrial biogenesis protein FimT